MPENNEIPELEFDEEKIEYLLENADRLHQFMTKEQIDSLIESLKNNLSKIEEVIEDLKISEKE
jgi:hypothetical protein